MLQQKNFLLLIIISGLIILPLINIPPAYPANPTTIYVSPTGNDNNTGTNWNNSVATITTAINLSQDNGTIILAEGTYTEPIWLTKNIQLKSDKGPNKTILTNLESLQFTIYTSETLTIQDISFQNCTAYYGSAITNTGTITCNHCIFQNCSSGLGGAISNTGTITCNHCTFQNCKSTTDSAEGGAIYNNGQSYINNCTFQNCSAGLGGAISNARTIQVTASQFEYNNATNGGVIYSYNYPCPGIITNNTLFQNCTFQYNNATQGNIAYTDDCISSWTTFNNSYFNPDNTNNLIGLITNINPIIHTQNTTTTTNTTTPPQTHPKTSELINLINKNTLTPVYSQPTKQNNTNNNISYPTEPHPENPTNNILPLASLTLASISLISTIALYLKPYLTKTHTQYSKNDLSQQVVGNSIITNDMLKKIEFNNNNISKNKELNDLVEKIKSNPNCCPCCTSVLYIVTLLQKDNLFTTIEKGGSIMNFLLGPIFGLYTLIKNQSQKKEE